MIHCIDTAWRRTGTPRLLAALAGGMLLTTAAFAQDWNDFFDCSEASPPEGARYWTGETITIDPCEALVSGDHYNYHYLHGPARYDNTTKDSIQLRILLPGQYTLYRNGSFYLYSMSITNRIQVIDSCSDSSQPPLNPGLLLTGHPVISTKIRARTQVISYDNSIVDVTALEITNEGDAELLIYNAFLPIDDGILTLSPTNMEEVRRIAPGSSKILFLEPAIVAPPFDSYGWGDIPYVIQSNDPLNPVLILNLGTPVYCITASTLSPGFPFDIVPTQYPTPTPINGATPSPSYTPFPSSTPSCTVPEGTPPTLTPSPTPSATPSISPTASLTPTPTEPPPPTPCGDYNGDYQLDAADTIRILLGRNKSSQ